MIFQSKTSIVAKKRVEIFNNKIRQGASKFRKGILKQRFGFSHVISLDADGELSPLHIFSNFLKTSNNFWNSKKKSKICRYLGSYYFKKKFARI